MSDWQQQRAIEDAAWADKDVRFEVLDKASLMVWGAVHLTGLDVRCGRPSIRDSSYTDRHEYYDLAERYWICALSRGGDTCFAPTLYEHWLIYLRNQGKSTKDWPFAFDALPPAEMERFRLIWAVLATYFSTRFGHD